MRKILLSLLVLLSWQHIFAQCTSEKGTADFPFTQNGLTVTVSGNYGNFPGTYTSCGVTVKPNCFLLSGATTVTNTFSSGVNDMVYNIVGVDYNETFTITVNNGTPALSLIGGNCSSNFSISGNVLTQTGGLGGTILKIHSTLPYTSVTLTHGAFDVSALSLCMDGVFQSVIPANPSVSSVSVPANSTYKAGDNLNFTVNYSAAVTVITTGGTPTFPITIGSTVYNAIYVSGSGTSALVFRYTVANGNIDTDGITVGSAIALNGGTIADANSNNATLTLANVAPTTAVLVDGVPPAMPVVTTPAANSTTTNNMIPITGTAEANSTVKVYLDATLLATVTADGSGNYSYVPTIALATGSHTIYTTAADAAGNISSQSTTNTFTVIQAQTITFLASPVKTYGAADFNAGATASSGLAVTYTSSNTAVATVDVTGLVHILAAGTTNITAAQAGNSSYTAATSVDQTLTVNKAPLTITANSQSKTYGSANPAFTASYSGFVNGDTNTSLTTQPAIVTTATAASATGTYPITVSGAASNNYNIAYVNGTLSVYPGAQIITFTVQPRTYGDADFSLNATASSGLPVSYSSSNPAVATVDAFGTVHIVSAGNVTISALQPGNGNYIATTTINQQLTVNKAALTVTADTLRKVYGAANPPLTVTYSGFVNGDTNASLTTQPTVGTTANAASAVGVYPVTVAGAASPNYLITYRSGTLTVGQNSQTLAYASPASVKTYGDADFSLPATSSSGLLVSYTSSNPEVATVDASGTVHIISAGSTTFTASQPGNANYLAAAPVAHILTVNKALLAVTSANQSKTYGAVNPPLTAIYTGFVNGDTNASLTTPPTFSTTAATSSAVGTYPVVAANAAAANYSITYTDGTLTVVKAALAISADNQARVAGLANPTLTLSYNGFVNGDTPADLAAQPLVATTAAASSAPGTYPITVSGAVSANYTISYTSGTLTVTNATVSSISLAQATLFENQPVNTPAGTLSATSLDPNATYTYTLVAGTGSTDNALFSIQGNKLVTAQSLDYEQNASYSILVRATNQYGLYLDQQFTINLNDVNEAPTLAAIANQSVCNIPSNQTINLTGITPGPETAQTTAVTVSSGNSALFSSLSVSSVSNGSATLTYQLAQPGTAVVTVTVKDSGGTANGGTDSFSQTFTLTSNAAPVAAISSDKGLQISKGETITLTATGGSVYSWDTTPNVSGSASTAVIQLRPGQTTTYRVKVSNASGCSSTGSITIQVNDDYSSIRPSNILTPNGDGKNDTWVVKNLDLYPNSTVSIFDRGGRLLNKVNHYNNDWDGMYNGVPLAEGTYYYVIDFGEGKGLLKGFITILRNR